MLSVRFCKKCQLAIEDGRGPTAQFCLRPYCAAQREAERLDRFLSRHNLTWAEYLVGHRAGKSKEALRKQNAEYQRNSRIARAILPRRSTDNKGVAA